VHHVLGNFPRTAHSMPVVSQNATLAVAFSYKRFTAVGATRFFSRGVRADVRDCLMHLRSSNATCLLKRVALPREAVSRGLRVATLFNDVACSGNHRWRYRQ
jgi:hypothetical protein